MKVQYYWCACSLFRSEKYSCRAYLHGWIIRGMTHALGEAVDLFVGGGRFVRRRLIGGKIYKV